MQGSRWPFGQYVLVSKASLDPKNSLTDSEWHMSHLMRALLWIYPFFSLPQLLWQRAGYPSHPAETERMQSGRMGMFSKAKKLSNRGRVMLTIMLMPRVIVTNVETVQFESVNYHLRRGQLPPLLFPPTPRH